MIIALQTLFFFRESLLNALDRLLRLYYNRLSLPFKRNGNDSDDDESEEQVFAEYDDDKGVVFYPPMYAQRYAAVSDCLIDARWCGNLEKVCDLGHHDMSFIKYLKDVPGIRCILGVDIETIPLRCSSDLLGCDDYIPKRENPLLITLFQGNAADPDYRLIGCDAVIAIEMIEHMLPHDLDRLVHTVFGFIKPWVVIFTTPNGDFNVLFKSMEKNGLRRLDHFFEWSREQYHDWCSNIVVRYPQYTVTCKGIGPGPPGTEHIGCCSQMAVFVSKDYHKQQDLTINSLALVASNPKQNNTSDLIDNWDVTELITEKNMLCPPSNIQSYTELLFSDKQSRVTILIATPNYSIESIKYQDKTSQCNLDSELGRSFLMSDDDQMCFNVLVPRRKFDNKVYEIEDVTSRLNCTTLQVKKFSKATQNLMAKNKSDTLVHTREVVDEIRNLTKMLNFNKDRTNDQRIESHPWYNINWGENAPYWNQYYKIVREYNYPFAVKSDDSRMLDLISEEINNLVDTQCEDEYYTDVTKLEIPLQYLMKVVKHISDDVDRVKDLLEWNGYEIVDDLVIHTRLVDNGSVATVATHEDKWHDNDTLSDWDATDEHSSSLSDGSNLAPEYHGRHLRRVLDHKLRKLRSMLTADEDISTELDHVVCRLMKLALHTCKARDTPPTTKWMQIKLLDLLTLTEKSIDRRKRHYIKTYPLTEDKFDKKLKTNDMLALEKIKEDNTAKEIVNKYRHLVDALDEHVNHEIMTCPDYGNNDFEVDDLSEISDFEYSNRPYPDLIHMDDIISEISITSDPSKADSLDRTQSWVKEDIEVVSYPDHDVDNTSGDTDHNISKPLKYKYKKANKKNRCDNKKSMNLTFLSNKEISYKKKWKTRRVEMNKNKEKIKSSKVIKKLTQINSGYNTSLKSSSSRYFTIKIGKYNMKARKYKMALHINTSLKTQNTNCHEDKKIINNKDYLETSVKTDYMDKDNISKKVYYNVSATEESCFVGIVMDGVEETIALRRTIGTDAEADSTEFENETLISDINDDSKDFYTRHEISTENVQSQTIFLDDINEPSTSKGIRHSVHTDVQCGPDITVMPFPTLSATTSFKSLPKTGKNGIKIEDSISNFETDTTDFGTLSYDCNLYGTITPRRGSLGIRIQDSDKCICEKTDCSPTTQALVVQKKLVIPNTLSNESKLQTVASNMSNKDYTSEICGSGYSLPKSQYPNSVNTSDIRIKTFLTKEVEAAGFLSITKYVRPKLSCGGVHIHTYREKQTSEDVIYQGEWQKYRPRAYVKRKPLKTFVAKKVIEPGIKRIKNSPRETAANTLSIQIKSDIKKSVQIFSAKNIRPKPEQNNAEKNTPHKVSAVSSVPVKKDNGNKKYVLKKNYTPVYLRKKDNPLRLYNQNVLNSSIDTVKTTIKENEILSSSNARPLIRSKTEEIKRDLLKINLPLCRKFEYTIFHNEIDNKGSTSSNQSREVNYNNRNSAEKKPQSPQSQNSSTCSSPSSIATVRISTKQVKNSSIRKKSSSINKCNLNASSSETPSPTRNKKFTKRCKSAKKTNENEYNTKENIPDSAIICNFNKEVDKPGKSVFTNSYKSVYIAQLQTEDQSLQPPVNTISKSITQSNKSNVKIIIGQTKNEKRRSSSSFRIQKSLTDSVSSQDNSINEMSKSSVSHTDFLIKSQKIKEKMREINSLETHIISAESVNKDRMNYLKNNLSKTMVFKKHVDNNVSIVNADRTSLNILDYSKNNITKPVNDTDDINVNIVTSDVPSDVISNHCKNSITKTIKDTIEESLDFIDESFCDDSSFDSESVILSLNDANPIYDDSAYLASFQTVNTNDDYIESTKEHDSDNALNRTTDSALGDETVVNLAGTSFTLTDIDLLSFQSVPSVSKHSEHVLNNSEFKIDTTKNNSFRKLFERKDLHLNKNLGGVLAIPAFSGFSINAESVAGDQPDPPNFMDSENGSLTLEFTRQATSEELFVSGRSSDSYESCVIDEDVVVPNWLFQIISHQQSINEQPQQMETIDPLPLDMTAPLAEPLYDANGNLVEPEVSAGTGAGDGHGIHSDQDSSGRGSSLSSSNTSSEGQSEAIIIDATAFTVPFELLEGPVIPALNATTGQLENLVRVVEVAENETEVPTEGPVSHYQMVTSDVDADVSSIDTDVPDSSDN